MTRDCRAAHHERGEAGHVARLFLIPHAAYQLSIFDVRRGRTIRYFRVKPIDGAKLEDFERERRRDAHRFVSTRASPAC